MNTIFIVEDKEETPCGQTSKNAVIMWQCKICGARVWLSTKRRNTNTNNRKEANYILSGTFEITMRFSHTQQNQLNTGGFADL